MSKTKSRSLAAASGALWLVIIAALVLGALLCIGGCAASTPPVTVAGSALARADARVESAIPHSDSTGKELLGMARKDIKVADSANTQAGRELEKARTDYQNLDGKWFVTAGRWAERVWRGFKWLVGLIAVAFIIGGILKGQSGLVAQITGIVYQLGLGLATFGGYWLVRFLRWAVGSWLTKKAAKAGAPKSASRRAKA